MPMTSRSIVTKLREAVSFRFTFGCAAQPPQVNQGQASPQSVPNRSFHMHSGATVSQPLFGLLVL